MQGISGSLPTAHPAESERSAGESGRVVSLIGRTPLVRLFERSGILPPGVEIWAKAEFLNPGGSVKDRTALSIVREAFRTGKLSSGRILLDASSGNTGIAYAMLGASLGFSVEIVLPKNASAERISRLRAHGATLTFSSPLESTDGAQRIAKEKARAEPEKYYYPDQYNNPFNPEAHYTTTGPEIYAQSRGKVTHFIAGVGTGGTITGTGRYLKERGKVEVVGVVPDAPLHGIEGLKHLPTSLRPGVLDDSVIDRWIEVSTEDARAVVRQVAQTEGLFIGTSSGAALHASFQLASELSEGFLVTVLPDGGERYLKESQWDPQP